MKPDERVDEEVKKYILFVCKNWCCKMFRGLGAGSCCRRGDVVLVLAVPVGRVVFSGCRCLVFGVPKETNAPPKPILALVLDV